MEDKDLTKIRVDIERYQEIIKFYRENPSRIEPNREPLYEIQNCLFNLSPIHLHQQFGRETGEGLSASVSINLENLTELLLQN